MIQRGILSGAMWYSLATTAVELLLDGIVHWESDQVYDVTAEQRWVYALTEATSAAFPEEKIVSLHHCHWPLTRMGLLPRFDGVLRYAYYPTRHAGKSTCI